VLRRWREVKRRPVQGNSPNDRILRGPDCNRPKRVCADSFPATAAATGSRNQPVPGMRLGRHAESIGPMGWSKPLPNRAVVCCLPLVGPEAPLGPHQELMMRCFSRLLSFADLVQNARALGMRFFRHGGSYRSDVSSHLINLGRRAASRSGPSQAIGRAGRNTPCPSSAMSSGRLFLDRVARQHCPSPLHRHTQITMHSSYPLGKGDISTLRRRGHFYFALTWGML
jgi:hypothetical protein